MDAYFTAFGQHLRSIRARQRLTQEDVAHRAGIHVTYLSGIERGVRNPSLKNIRAVADALGVPVAALFSFETDPALDTPADTPTQSHDHR